MRSFPGYLSWATSAFLRTLRHLGSYVLETPETNAFLMPGHEYIPGWHRGGKRNYLRTGRHYPHSSTRQRARYARQLAAGQLRIEIIMPPEPAEAKGKAKPRVKRKAADAA